MDTADPATASRIIATRAIIYTNQKNLSRSRGSSKPPSSPLLICSRLSFTSHKMDPNFVQGLHNLLVQTTSNDTTQLKAATAQLNQEYYKNPACISALASIITSSPEQAVRQLAAVEMRKRVSYNSGTLWTALPQNEREQIKSQFPQLILNESSNLVRHSAARVVAAIASIELPMGTWSNLLPFLQQTSTSSDPSHREVGVYMLFTSLENIVEGFQDHLQSLFQLFSRTLVDPDSIEVRITTVKAMGVIAQFIDSDDKNYLNQFQSLLPGMIQVIGQCVETSNESGARQLFDVLETLLILEVPILSKNIPDLVEFLLRCGGNINYDTELRVLALNALNWTVQYKKSKLQSANLAGTMLELLMPVTTEDEPEDIDEDAPSRSALRIIDGLSTNLPPMQVFPALRNLIVQYFSSQNPAQRRGAMLALGIAVEGCSEYMTPLMSQVWPIIEAGLQDGDASVRKATCVAVSCFCEWLEDDCVGKHNVLVPAILNLIEDPETQRSACTALDALLEILHDVIDQYLSIIMDRLTVLLQSAPLNVKAVVTGAIGSAAHASKERFIPYFEPAMEHLQHFLVLTGEGEEIELRGITMDAVGTFAEAVGKDLFRPYFATMMTQAFQGIEMGSARLRECSFLFFGVMARVFAEEFAPYLPQVVPPLLQSCKQAEGGEELSVSDVSAAFDSGMSPSSAINVSDERDVNGMPTAELEDIDLDKLMDVNSAIAVEKEIAADTIGTLFAATKGHFLPFVEQSTLELVQLLLHYYEGIRKSALDSLLEIVRTFYELSNPEDWQPGAAVRVPLQNQVKELVGHILPPLIDMYETEDNKSVVSALCVSLAETINKVGPAFVEGQLEPVCNIAIQILEQKAFCQQDPDQDEEEEAPEAQAEYDSVLISSAGDLVAALANALGSDFTPAFNRFFPLIAKFYKKSRSLSDRSSAIGCLAEIISGMKSAVTPLTEPLLELFYKALSDPDAEVLSNAAFAVGLLIEHSEVDLSPQYIHLLGALRPLFDVSPDLPPARLNAKDNAAGAVARMIVRNTGAVPLDQVLPVFINALPLKNDYLENRPVFRAIFHLTRTNSAALGQYMDQLLQVFATVLDPNGPDQVGDQVRGELIQLIGALNTENPAKIQTAGLGVFVPGA
uniref:Importin N-terminal domain-containing protein n=1 Tax=Moniliophthora roreri TaxID=221103 RepID=A0A0W0GA03_MONRR